MNICRLTYALRGDKSICRHLPVNKWTGLPLTDQSDCRNQSSHVLMSNMMSKELGQDLTKHKLELFQVQTEMESRNDSDNAF